MIAWLAARRLDQRVWGTTVIANLTLTEIEPGTTDPFDSDSGACEALLGRTACPTVFLSPWWMSAWHTVFAGDAAPRIIQIRDGDTLVGVAPLLQTGDRLILAGDPDLFDYQDLVFVKGRESELTGALLDHLDSANGTGPAWASLELPSVPADSPNAAAVTAAAEERGYGVESEEIAVAPVADLPVSWDEFLAGLTKKHRHELRRKIRRLEDAGEVRHVTVTGSEGLDTEMEEFLRLMCATNQDKADFLTPERRRFFHLLADRAAAREALRLSFLEVDGTRMAACLMFDYAGVYMLYNSGYDPARSDLSVGLINKAFAIREAIELGRRRFDFLKGGERYKYRLGGLDRAIYRIVVTRSP